MHLCGACAGPLCTRSVHFRRACGITRPSRPSIVAWQRNWHGLCFAFGIQVANGAHGCREP